MLNIKELANLAKTVFKNTTIDVVSINSVWNDRAGVHLSLESFMELFENNYVIKERDSDIYPYEAFSYYDGVEFRALLSHEEAAEIGLEVKDGIEKL